MLCMMCIMAVGLVATAAVSEESHVEQCDAGHRCKRLMQKGQQNAKAAMYVEDPAVQTLEDPAVQALASVADGSTSPTNCSFEHKWYNWNTYGDFAWSRAQRTPSLNTGPSSAADGNWFLYSEASGQIRGAVATLSSPPLKLSQGMVLRFKYNIYGSPMGSLEVTVNGNLVWIKRGPQGSKWQSAEVDLRPYQGTNPTIAFVGRCGPGSISGAAIDEIQFIPAAPAPTPAPTTCKCTGTSNQYSCTDGTTAYCATGSECYATEPFAKGSWDDGCRVGCWCMGYTAGNKYSCSNGYTAYCPSYMECYATQHFTWGSWDDGCRWRKGHPTPYPTPSPTPHPTPPPVPQPPWLGVRGRQPPVKLEKEYSDYSPLANDVTRHPECSFHGMWLGDKPSVHGLLLEVHGQRGCLARKAARPPLHMLASLGQVESESNKAWPGTAYSLTTYEDRCQRFRRVAHSNDSLVMLKGLDPLGRKTGRNGHGGVGYLGQDPAALSNARDFQRDCAGNQCVFREGRLASGQMVFVQQHGVLVLLARQRGQAWGMTAEDITLYQTSSQCRWTAQHFGGETTPERCAMLVRASGACGSYFMWSATAERGGPDCVCCGLNGQDGSSSNEYSVWKVHGKNGGGGGGGGPTTTSTTPNGVGFCSRCEWPWYGNFCEKKRTNAYSSIDVLVIVFVSTISTDLQKRLDQYRADLEMYESLTSDVLAWDLPRLPSLRPQRDLRHLIKMEYVYRQIRAVFLVGDYPLAWATFDDGEGGQRNGPILSYLSHFSGAQQFLPSSGDSNLYNLVKSENQRHADIAIGIINHAPEQTILNYFDRLHSHRAMDGSSHPRQAQWSFNGGDWRCDDVGPLYTGGYGIGSPHYCHEGKYEDYKCPSWYKDCKEENRNAYRPMLQNSTVHFEYYHAKAHSWAAGFSFGVELPELMAKPFSGIRFFNLFHCSSAKTSEPNLAMAMAIASQHGLASVGTTHTGAMLSNDIFERYLEEGDSWGEALRKWWQTRGNDRRYDDWHAGITGYGDPMVRMRGGKYRQGDKPGGSLTQESEEDDPLGKGMIDNATLQKLREAFVYDKKLEREHAEDDVSFEEYERLMTDMYL